MSMVGHEQVKAYFLSVLDKISISKRWGKSMDEWSFDLVLHGNDGTGEFIYPSKVLCCVSNKFQEKEESHKYMQSFCIVLAWYLLGNLPSMTATGHQMKTQRPQ
jgi:hypothetical protein